MLTEQRKKEIFMARRDRNYLASLRLEGLNAPTLPSDKTSDPKEVERLIKTIKAQYAR